MSNIKKILVVGSASIGSTTAKHLKEKTMSYNPCKYCSEIGFKTDGTGELICFNRANTGDCKTPPLKQLNSYEENNSKRDRPRPKVNIREEYDLIQQKKSALCRSDRDWVVQEFNKLKY